MLREILKENFFKNSFIAVSGSVAAGFLGYLFHFAVSRRLSVEQYGELQVLLSFFVIITVFSTSLSNFIIKYTSVFAQHKDYASNRDFMEKLARKVLSFNILILAVFFLLIPIIQKILHLSSPIGIIFMALATTFAFSGTIYQGVLSGWEKFFQTNVSAVVGALAKLVLGILVVYFYPEAKWAISAVFGGTLAAYLVGRFYIKPLVKNQAKSEDWSEKYFSSMEIKKSWLPIFFFSLALILTNNIDIIIVRNLTSAELTGFYGALSILGKIILWVNLSVSTIIFPSACAGGQKGISRKLYRSAYISMSVFGLGSVLFYRLFPDFVISLLFGGQYEAVAGDLWLFSFMAFLLSLLSFEANLAFARHDFRVSYILVISVLAMLGGIQLFHGNLREIVLAVSLAYFLGYVMLILLNFRRRIQKTI